MKRRQLLSYSLLFLAGCTGSRVGISEPDSDGSDSLLTFSVTDEQGLAPLTAKYEPLRAELSRLLTRDLKSTQLNSRKQKSPTPNNKFSTVLPIKRRSP